ncbi:MAG TPA: sigma-E factor negative regulatory protein [Steroidobacteraceae bacterium]|nr:sigma-E factor negative regulatory protein [Steroidobacteraceae bacterium]
MNQDERASQLSAMFDGELPAAECELLSRRLARDEQLRATWSRYSVIGAALRAEPLAQVRPDFAHRVSAALAGASPARAVVRRGRLLRGAALGSAVAAGVAGVAIMMLRNGLPVQEVAATAAPAAQASAPMQVAASNLRLVTAAPVAAGAGLASYTVPPLGNDNNLALQGSLADYVVAHSEYSSPLARRNLLSDLVGNEQVQPAPASPKADGAK